jgi:capsular exopolysaccharide synthesis family protein
MLKKQTTRESQERSSHESLVTLEDPTNATTDAYHTLAANLLYGLADTPSKVIVLTSPGPGEGKTTICANLGVVLAQAGQSVLLIDCNLHRPAVHRAFGLQNLQGLEDVLAGERRAPEIWRKPVTGLKVITAGSVPPYPAELLSSKRFKTLLSQGSGEFDYVLIDSPSLAMTVPDPLILAKQGDGVLLVLDARSTRKGAVREAMNNLKSVQANVLGTVVNNGRVGR